MDTNTTKPTGSALKALLKGDGIAKAFFLMAAFLSFLFSVSLWFKGYREEGLFVGIWVPSICSSGALILAGRRHG
ncbi:MAG: hypothetical protein P8L44_13060 [Opitutales bacterium]|nr:hypothetical protein [Opitutales bacterium]